MKKLIIAAIAAISAGTAVAEPPRDAALGVRVSDINLTGSKPPGVLVNRILDRMYSICGDRQTAALSKIMTGGGDVERAACKAQLQVNDTRPIVQAAFAEALERFK
jgi:hypothetical protein